ncbi:hypothetical protein TruAng_011169 [Truncatella angustata]|nr:hypothetical protein TruAng_011169 [Truncatella angustata]
MDYEHFATTLFVVVLSLPLSIVADPTCNTTYTSGIPFDVFSGTLNVYSQFCDEVGKYNGHESVSWTVNTTGDMLSNTLPRFDWSFDRTPAADGYTIDLAYNPTTRGVPCAVHAGCTEIFQGFSSVCGHNGASKDLMAYQASAGSGCGLYTYFITPPANAVSERRCYPLNYFGHYHMKVQDWVLNKLIHEFVCIPDRQTVHASDNSTWLWNEKYTINNVPYLFQVYWQDGCYQQTMEADFNFPIPGRQDVNCSGLLWDDFTQCSQNDGVGGNITVGCLVYEYKTIDQRVHGGF